MYVVFFRNLICIFYVKSFKKLKRKKEKRAFVHNLHREFSGPPLIPLVVTWQKHVAIIKVLSVKDRATVFYSEFYYLFIFFIFFCKRVVRQGHILMVIFTFFFVVVSCQSLIYCAWLCMYVCMYVRHFEVFFSNVFYFYFLFCGTKHIAGFLS